MPDPIRKWLRTCDMFATGSQPRYGSEATVESEPVVLAKQGGDRLPLANATNGLRE